MRSPPARIGGGGAGRTRFEPRKRRRTSACGRFDVATVVPHRGAA
ncbi:hypothetical protein Cus16_0602 [Curtobacterium sp. ER1/6]|nr:hypothetical protein Cus16_0602 [Curtobacterium sp. ER1/6]